ncbi:MAG: AgmX/PglI C-terminal domain-containing protein [Deltaproteobacteria bacterium]|nr:AgmX/PglI C-terminal domain-containing protein [Deltaproteobacteria bacterium]
MESFEPEDRSALRRELRQARTRLDELVQSLREIDGTLQGLEAERTRFELIDTACKALIRLEELGGGALFWQGRDAIVHGGPEHLALVRSRFDDFEKQLALVEERRQGLLDEIANTQDTADLFAGHILDAERIEEEKKSEWLVEREVDQLPIRPSLMPWVRGQEEDRRFRKTLLLALLVSTAIGVVFPMIEIPLPERWEILEDQQRLTQLIREELPKPPVAVVKEEPKPVVPVDPEEPAIENDDSAAPELADTARSESNPAPAEKANTGQGSGPGSGSRGILAFREKFSGIAATNDAVDRLGANAQIHDPNAVADGLPERSLVTSNAPGSSGGINVAALSRGTGGTGTQLSGVAVTRATSTLGTGTGNGSGHGTGNGSGDGKGGGRNVAGGGAHLGRTDEEIQIVFDRHKSALYRLYNRELRQNPTLKGQMVLRLTIQPDGTVSFCEVKSTDMKAPQLAQQVVERVKGFDFGAKSGIPAVTIVYPIDFLPAT